MKRYVYMLIKEIKEHTYYCNHYHGLISSTLQIGVHYVDAIFLRALCFLFVKVKELFSIVLRNRKS